MSEKTTIWIDKLLKNKLNELGTSKDTLNNVVQRLYDFWIIYGPIIKEERKQNGPVQESLTSSKE